MSDEEGVTPFEVVRDTTPVWVTPTPGKGALGTWRYQGGPRTLSRDKPTLEAGTSLRDNRQW
jgi:hypothetical protein